MNDLIGQTALITGASTGIGRAVALAFVKQGVKIAACSRSRAGLETVREEIQNHKGEIIVDSVDVRCEDQVDAFARKTMQTYGKIDILIANAGFAIFKTVSELTIDDFDQQIATNLRGVFISVKAVLPQMIQNEFGDIIIISSLAGKNGFATGGAYCASKFGVRGFAQSLMPEVRNKNIRVMTVCPGSVDTPFFDNTHMTPNRDRILQPDDIASSIVAALCASRRAMISEIEIRPANP